MVEEIIEEQSAEDIIEEPELKSSKVEIGVEEEIINTIDEELLASLPETYKTNNEAEKRALELAENFRLQYAHLYPNRMPVLLAPTNEAGISKVICTFVRSGLLEYTDFYYWNTIASFIKDFLTLKLLDRPTEIPSQISSPQSVIQNQSANCFEYTNVLVSLLIGAGYDAYIVSGYATRQICNADESHDTCPPETEEPPPTPPTPKKIRKYQVRGAKDLTSKFEAMMLERERIEIERLEKERIDNEFKEQLLKESPSEDKLHGRRIHSWILIKSGKREISSDFFIEPFTGVGIPIEDDRFLGVESVWNGRNYFVCLQDNSQGCKKINWDLKDQTIWEPLVARGKATENTEDEEDEQESYPDIEPDLPQTLPLSWCKAIKITPQQFEARSPNGRKVILYRRAKVELFAPHVNEDGLVSRVTNYSDTNWKDVIDERCEYKSRQDLLYKRYTNYAEGRVAEKFESGRPNSLIAHEFNIDNRYTPEVNRTIHYKDARPDGLIKLVETLSSITQHFCNRDDKLFFREVKFEESQPRRLLPSSNEKIKRKIKEITEKFRRNETIENADSDLHEKKFSIAQEKISIIYHKKDGFITSSTRTFDKPDNADDKFWNVSFSPDLTTLFTAYNGTGDPLSDSEKTLPVYNDLVNALKSESKSVKAVAATEEQIREDLKLRQSEDKNPKLEISVHDVFRNENAMIRRDYLRQQAELEAKRQQETEMDYLVPFLAQIGDPPSLNRSQGMKLHKECLEDLKARLIDQANLIQERFELETNNLQAKQQEYQQKQISMTKEDEEAYRSWCADSMFRIQILEMRLNRHKLTAPQKYAQLDMKLKNDPRLRM